MIILSHRGYWKTPAEKNSITAFERSFDLGFGTETDFRDMHKSLVISHDPPDGDALPAGNFFEILASRNSLLPLAVNVKSDGLQSLLKEQLERYNIQNYFLFDMAVPDAIVSIKYGLRVFTRHSDVETDPCFYRDAAGVWVDAFYNDGWISQEVILRHLDAGKQVCLVSPELHGRNHLSFWERLVVFPFANHPNLMLCSDIPEEAQAFFQYA
jgi:hypothetical protein